MLAGSWAAQGNQAALVSQTLDRLHALEPSSREAMRMNLKFNREVLEAVNSGKGTFLDEFV